MWLALVVTCAPAMVGTESARTLTEAEEQALCAGFVAREGDELRLVEVLRPLMQRHVRRRTPSLWRQMEDLEQSGFLKLYAMREQEAERKKIRPPLVELVARLLQTDVKRRWRFARRHDPLTPEVFEAQVAPGSPDAALEVQNLRALVRRLPDEQALVLLNHLAEEDGAGPPLHEALGTTPKLARMRLAYARKLLRQLVDGQPDAEVAHA